jgi:hypothetical protein
MKHLDGGWAKELNSHFFTEEDTDGKEANSKMSVNREMQIKTTSTHLFEWLRSSD